MPHHHKEKVRFVEIVDILSLNRSTNQGTNISLVACPSQSIIQGNFILTELSDLYLVLIGPPSKKPDREILYFTYSLLD